MLIDLTWTRNYSAFIAISKEIATLENEMLELKTVLEEFKTIPASLDTGVGPEDAGLGGSISSSHAFPRELSIISRLTFVLRSQRHPPENGP